MPSLKAFLLSGLLAAADASRGKLSTYSTICGDTSIWTILTEDPSLHGAVNIKFDLIESMTSARVKEIEAKIEILKAELEALAPRIAEALEKERVPAMSEAQVDELIGAAFEGTFGSVDMAKSTQCGDRKSMSKEQRKSLSRTLFKDTTAAFGAKAEKFLADAGVIFNGDLWSARFWSQVGKGGYCDQLAQELRDLASSKSPPLHPVLSTQLQTRKREIEDEIRKLVEKKHQCETARGSIKAFETNMVAHKTTVNERHEDWRKAKNALDDAENDLDEVADELEGAEEKVHAIKEKLKGEKQEEQDATNALEELENEEKDWKGKVEETGSVVRDLGGKVAATGKADDVVEALRSLVSVTTLKMRLLFEAAVLAPVESAGLSGDTQLSEYFFERLELVPSEEEMSTAVDDLTEFCTAEAMPVFKEVKEVDLSPLCAVGEAQSIKGSIHASMSLRISQVQDLIKHVQTWFDPLKGLQIPKTEIPKRLAAGEPEGLVQVMSVYSDADFFQYLKGWAFKGEFLKLIAQLRDAEAALESSLEKSKEQLKTFTEGAAAIKAKREAASKKLDAAKETAAATEAEKDEINEVINTLKAQNEKLEILADSLAEQVDQALQALIKAKEAVKALFTEETGVEAAAGLTMR